MFKNLNPLHRLTYIDNVFYYYVACQLIVSKFLFQYKNDFQVCNNMFALYLLNLSKSEFLQTVGTDSEFLQTWRKSLQIE